MTRKTLPQHQMTDEKKGKFMSFSNQNGSLLRQQLGAIRHNPKHNCGVLGCYGGIFTEDVKDVSPNRRYQS